MNAIDGTREEDTRVGGYRLFPPADSTVIAVEATVGTFAREGGLADKARGCGALSETHGKRQWRIDFMREMNPRLTSGLNTIWWLRGEAHRP